MVSRLSESGTCETNLVQFVASGVAQLSRDSDRSLLDLANVFERGGLAGRDVEDYVKGVGELSKIAGTSDLKALHQDLK